MANFTVCALYNLSRYLTSKNYRYPSASLENKIMGTILLAHEGINGTISGSNESIHQFISYLQEDPRFKNIDHKLSSRRKSILPNKSTFKKEIVTMGKDDTDPRYSTGTYIEPDQWNELIEDEENLLIDTEMNMKLVLKF